MQNSAQQKLPEGAATDTEARSSSMPEHASEDASPAAYAGLSNDFLNHYSEALMLIEMAAYDPSVSAELMEWRPVSYRAYFAASELRRASAALVAYEALPAARRQAFEKLIAAMDTLATMAIFALQPPTEPENAPVIIEATAPAMRNLIAQAGAFLNSGGQELATEGREEEAQALIDRIIEQAGSRAA